MKVMKEVFVIQWDNDFYSFPVLGPCCNWTRKKKKLASKVSRIKEVHT